MRLETGRYCGTCRRQTLHAREVFSTGWGIFLTIVTAGGFLLLWVPLAVLSQVTHPWRCQRCGSGRTTVLGVASGLLMLALLSLVTMGLVSAAIASGLLVIDPQLKQWIREAVGALRDGR